MQVVNVVFVPVPVPCAGVTHSRSPPTPPYPRERERGRWPLTTPVPVGDLSRCATLLADAKRIIAEGRASKLLRYRPDPRAGSE